MSTAKNKDKSEGGKANTVTAKPVQAGPGRPTTPKAPRDAHQLALADALEAAEKARDEAELVYGATPTVQTQLAMFSAELRVASGWAAYCRAQGIHATALKYAEDRNKIAARIAALQELLAVDTLKGLKEHLAMVAAAAGRGGDE